MSSTFPYPCQCGCGRSNVVSKPGNSCGRPQCNKNWYEANSLAGKYKNKVLEFIKKSGEKFITKQVIRAAVIGIGVTIPGGIAGYLFLELLYQILAPYELH